MTRRPWVPNQVSVDASPARRQTEVLAGRSSHRPDSAFSLRGPQWPPLVAEPSSRSKMRGASAVRPRRRDKSLRRLGLILGTGAVAIVLAVTLHGVFGNTNSFPAPSEATLTGLSVPQRIVVIAESQVGYGTQPANSYCDKYSAYWGSGTADCPSGEMAEEWCADFAAWAWQEAGVDFTYGYGPGEINGAAVSFYEWGVANGEWHPATSGYVAAPGGRGGLWPLAWDRPLGRARGDRHQRSARPAGPGRGERGRG
jgi:hypothetical protein